MSLREPAARLARALRVLALAAVLPSLACGSVGAVAAAHPQNSAFAPYTEEPWEPALSAAAHVAATEHEAPAYRPVGDVFSWLVDYYRAEIGPDSIRRCPFHETCSALAQRALREHGALGILWILDRYFYREHTAAGGYYARVSERSGVLRLDDALLTEQH